MIPLELSLYYTYVLRSRKNGQWYTGFTRDVVKRLKEHNDGHSTYTKQRGPYDLIYFKACHNVDDARAREKYLKSGMGKRYIRNRIKNFLTLTG